MVETIALVLLISILGYILFKPNKKSLNKKATHPPTVEIGRLREQEQQILPSKQPIVQQVRPLSNFSASVNKTVKALQQAEQEQKQQGLKHEHTVQSSKPNQNNAWHELSQEEEVALAQAMEAAGKQAVAETLGAPHQTEFFEATNVAQEAVKKMFSGAAKATKTDVSAESTMPTASKQSKPHAPLDFLMLYFMAPRSETYPLRTIFQIMERLGLQLNAEQVFEYADAKGLRFYVASALKPGTFNVAQEGHVPGLSFIIDLRQVQQGVESFHKLLSCLDQLAEELRGDILDEQRQRLTHAKMNEYLIRIKNFQPKTA